MMRHLAPALALAVLLAACDSSSGDGTTDSTTPPDVVGLDTPAPTDLGDADLGTPQDTGVAADVPDPLTDIVAPEDLVAGVDQVAPADQVNPGPDGSSDTATTLPSAGGWCLAWTQRYCALLARCPHPTSPIDDLAGCVAERGAWCLDGEAVAAAVEAGDLTYDAEAADGCLTLLDDMDCDGFDERLATEPRFPDGGCYDVLMGTVAPGGPCSLGNECAPGSRCVVDESCPGTCEAYATIGEDCGVEALCDYSEALCVGGTCQPLPDEAGDPCVLSYCQAPLVCDRSSDTCRRPGLPGEACDDAAPCLTGLLCFGDDEGTCLPTRTEAESCFENADCFDWSLETTLVCAGGSCAVAPGVDEPCYDYYCEDAWCDLSEPTSPTCRALPPAGEACASGNRCAAGAWCDDGTCAQKRPAGQPCDSALACAASRCVAGLCLATDDPVCPD